MEDFTDSPNKYNHNFKTIVKTTTAGKSRWDILKKVILQKKLRVTDVPAESKRTFQSFKLFTCKTYSEAADDHSCSCTDPGCTWVLYSLNLSNTKSVLVHQPNLTTNLQDLTSFNNTGNVCLWPAEEVLAYYCVLHQHNFKGKSFVELGGGYSCLAGLCVALNTQVLGLVLLTDGNKKCVDSIQSTINANAIKLQDVNVQAHCIRWDIENSYEKYCNQFDFVICADCLFFDECRNSLANAIFRLLKPNGIALIFAPKRGHTLQEFVNICKPLFQTVEQNENYCDRISNIHRQELEENPCYDSDIHFPILIKLVKQEL